MSAPSRIAADWTCPFCKTLQRGLVYFKFGTLGCSYRIGDQILWEGMVYKSRPADGTAKVRGWTSCNNTWRMRWLAQLGLAERAWIGWPPEGHQLPSWDERKRLGCPEGTHVDIEIVANEIKGISFPTKFEELVVNEY